ncbi:unnamed protein product [Acanthoscelides obtectus]|uniref:Uncharacterized protein n=1 Tax=Acanthoscelides obtectus TaxID=200917 RepID=A0A9P0P6G7_ACAOB|nr:unnamed protein product [Acanthoscelides obtectus]CAK1666934.1 hypothetical protein AOBTE_LOCUS25561 [Acanthoscelides obtectus]
MRMQDSTCRGKSTCEFRRQSEVSAVDQRSTNYLRVNNFY